MSALKIADRDGITVVTFARPPVNAMDSASLEELAADLRALGRGRGGEGCGSHWRGQRFFGGSRPQDGAPPRPRGAAPPDRGPQ